MELESLRREIFRQGLKSPLAYCRQYGMMTLMRTLLSILLLSLSLIAQANGPSLEALDAHRAALRPFLDAVAHVESGCDDEAIGDAGRAIGRYQIWEAYWSDALVKAPAIKGEYDDCKGRVYAERVLVAYMLRYAAQAVKDKDYETLARIHNGGPKGATKRATLKYWEKIEKALAK